MDIIEALKSKDHWLRVDNGDKWLVFDTVFDRWIVYEKKFGARKIVNLIETTDQTAAITILLKDD